MLPLGRDSSMLGISTYKATGKLVYCQVYLSAFKSVGLLLHVDITFQVVFNLKSIFNAIT